MGGHHRHHHEVDDGGRDNGEFDHLTGSLWKSPPSPTPLLTLLRDGQTRHYLIGSSVVILVAIVRQMFRWAIAKREHVEGTLPF